MPVWNVGGGEKGILPIFLLNSNPSEHRGAVAGVRMSVSVRASV